MAEELPARLSADIVRHDAVPPRLRSICSESQRSARRMGEISVSPGMARLWFRLARDSSSMERPSAGRCGEGAGRRRPHATRSHAAPYREAMRRTSAAWVAAALGALAAGSVLVPLDDMADVDPVMPALKASGAQSLFMSQLTSTTPRPRYTRSACDRSCWSSWKLTRAGNRPWTARLI